MRKNDISQSNAQEMTSENFLKCHEMAAPYIPASSTQ